MRKKIVAGNWKMNLSAPEAIQLATELKSQLSKDTGCEVILFPSFIYLSDIKRLIDGSLINLGAQDCSDKENGAFTGQVSASQLQSAGIEYVLIGHSERREYNLENHEMLRTKLQLALQYGLKPVFCCGEPLAIRQSDAQKGYVKKQLDESLFGFSESELSKITIAYEPVWAIGTGLNATPDQAQEMHTFIREQIRQNYSASLADAMRILYGGSCKPDNAKELFACPDVDGGLIGGASLKVKDFLALTEAAR